MVTYFFCDKNSFINFIKICIFDNTRLIKKLMKSIYKLLLIFGLFTCIVSCKNNLPTYNDPIPKHDTFTINSKNVNETRTINVWVPDNYSTSTDSLMVMYMPDGGTKEDFPHIANTLAELIQSNKITPVILVGIENTQRRRDLTGKTEVEEDKKIAPIVGGSTEFRAFLKDELFPEINKRYRTTNKKGIIGESLAGLFVIETFLEHPDMFDVYIAMDPSLWWNNKYLIRTAKDDLAKFPSTPKKIWFAGSQATDISASTNQLAEILKTTHLPNLEWTYSDEPKEDHSTIYRATKEKALIWALKK